MRRDSLAGSRLGLKVIEVELDFACSAAEPWLGLERAEPELTVTPSGFQTAARGFRSLLRFFILACQKRPKKECKTYNPNQKIPYSESKFDSVC